MNVPADGINAGTIRFQTRVELADYRKLVFRQTYSNPVYILINLVCVGTLIYNSVQGVNNLTTVFVIVFLFYMPIMLFFKARSNYKASKALHEMILYEITPETITIKGPSFDSVLQWRSLYKVGELRDWFLLYTSKQMAMLLPKKAFPSAADVARFREWSERAASQASTSG
ncbi:MAG TPA: YcxB family protein [Chryseosolibacter sp.]|nr:YcxB family protein [Chryseosolibacter sp.]